MKRIDCINLSPVEDRKSESKDGEALLSAVWSVPFIAPTQPSGVAGHINRHYQSLRRFLAKYTDDVLIPQALRQKAFYKVYGAEYIPHSMTSGYTVTLNKGGILSLYTDRCEFAGGVNRFILRTGDTWDLQSGYPLHINLNKYKRSLLRLIEAQARSLSQDGATFYAPLRRNLRRYWDSDKWYLTNEGLAIFYSQVTIAPHEAGIPVFVIPYGQLRGMKRIVSACGAACFE